MGEWDDRHDGQPASNLGVSAVFGSGQGKTADKESNSKKVEASAVPRVTMDANKRSTTPAVSGASRVETAKTLTSAKGVFALPAEDKDKPSGNPAPPKDKPGSAESEIQAADGHGAAGVVTGKGTGPNPPPNGASLLQVGTIPTYPKNAANEGVEGVVGLRIHASGEGKISTVEVSRPSGDKRLDDIAVRTVIKYWRLKPFSQDYVLNVAVRFKGGAKVDLDYGEVEFASPEA
jgi:TonB family protein